jgi:hypothetical protein
MTSSLMDKPWRLKLDIVVRNQHVKLGPHRAYAGGKHD